MIDQEGPIDQCSALLCPLNQPVKGKETEMKLWRFVLSFLVIPVLLLFPLLLMAFQPADPTDLVGVLTWLAGMGAVYVVGYAVSFLIEKVPGWGTKVPGWAKAIIIIVGSVGVAVGAQYLLQRADVLVVWGPIFRMIVSFVLAYLGTQKAFAFQSENRLLAHRFI